jgi:hypothetical protein
MSEPGRGSPFIWSIRYEGSDAHWLEVRDTRGWRSAIVRCDEETGGELVFAVEYYRHVSIPLDQRRGTCTRQVTDVAYEDVVIDLEGSERRNYDDYFPIQNLDEEIDWMLALREAALRWFKSPHLEERQKKERAST